MHTPINDLPFDILGYALMTVGLAGYALFLSRGDLRLRRLASWCSLLACLSIALGLAARGVQVGHWPLITSYEFALAFVASILLLSLLLERREEAKGEGIIALFLAFLLATYFLFLTPASLQVARPSLPLLRSWWFLTHTVAAAVGYGAFAVAGGMGIVYLLRPLLPFLSHWFPEPEALDSASAYAVRIGFPWMTLSIAAGGIWALLSWGIFWNWDLKETWTLVVWLVYLFYWHARALPRWPGRRTAIVAAIGLAVVLFAFLGMRWLAQAVSVEPLQIR